MAQGGEAHGAVYCARLSCGDLRSGRFTTPPTPEQIEDFLAGLPDLWDYELEDGNLFDDEPPEAEDHGWRQSDFV